MQPYYKLINKNAPKPPQHSIKHEYQEQISTPAKTEKVSTKSTSLKKNIISSGSKETYTIDTDLYKATISSEGGGTIKSFILKNYEMRKGGDTTLVQLINDNEKSPLLIRYISIDGDTVELNQNFKLNYVSKSSERKDYFTVSGDDSITMSFVLRNKNAVVAKKIFKFYGNKYTIGLDTDLSALQNNSAADFYELSWNGGLSYTESFLKDDIYYSKAYAYSGGEFENFNIKSGKKKQSRSVGKTRWTAIRTKYFAASFISENLGVGYKLTGTGIPINGSEFQKIFTMHLMLPLNSPSHTTVFIGPLEYSIIKGLSFHLEHIMTFGFKLIKPISKGILWTFIKLKTLIPNYGWVLIIFSILVKIVLSPFTNKSTRSMKEMQNLQPKIAALKEKYKNDPQKINAATMKLYKEHGVNPMGGCLPLLLQMPILFALFTIFRSTIELRHAPFILWITDLSAPDTILTLPFKIPIYGQNVNVLPLIMAFTTLLQQKFSTATASNNPQQKMMMYFMPIMMFFLFNQFPSGLNLYYTLFNILSVLQQNFLTPKPKPKKVKKSAFQTFRQIQAKAKKK